MNIFFIAPVLFFFSCGTSRTRFNKENDESITPDSINAIGLWQVPINKRYINGSNHGTNWASGPDPERFNYDGKYITIMLMTEKAWMWKSPDDYYKVNSKWGHDTLYYLPPFGSWEKLAIYKNGSFMYSYEIYDSLYTWTYKKIGKDELDSGYTNILDPRKAHDYSIKPMDTYKE